MMTMAGFQIGTGEIFVAIASVITAISSVTNKLQLQSIPLGIFTIYRNLLGTVIFFVIANIFYGKEHFADAFTPLLWQWMLLYALVIVVIARLCWLEGLKKATPTELNLATSLNPILSIFMAYVILSQVPTLAQYYGLSLLIIGVILNFIGNQHQGKMKQKVAKSTDIEKMDTAIGFRGM